MKNILSILAMAAGVLLFSNGINASGYANKTESGEEGVGSMIQAIKYAEMAKTHKAHAEHILQHAEKSLEFAKKAEAEAIAGGNDKGRRPITESIRHLVEAINHAKMGHTDIASEHITDALEQMHQFATQ